MRSTRPLSALAIVATVAALTCAGAAHAQYKVIGPDGKVTYTDRSPTSEQGRVVPLGSPTDRSAVASAEQPLPLELRPIAQRYPVTLYTTSNACEPCNAARSMLRQRGIPYSERQVVTTEDSDALERITGARDAPTLTIGAQTLRGYSADQWSQYLDLAGYPKTSQLPATWTARATPIVERRDATPTARVAAPQVPTAPTAPPAGAAGIRF